MKKIVFLFVLVLILASVILAACAPDTSAPTPCGFGPIEGGKTLYEAKHIKGALYQLTGETRLSIAGECESGLPFNIDNVDGKFLGAYSYTFVYGEESHPDFIWIIGHNK